HAGNGLRNGLARGGQRAHALRDPARLDLLAGRPDVSRPLQHRAHAHAPLRHARPQPEIQPGPLPPHAPRHAAARHGAAGSAPGVTRGDRAQRHQGSGLDRSGIIRRTSKMEQLAYHDLRSFVEAAKKVSDWRQIDGADWDGEIGALVESTAELVPQPPMLIFDKIKGYPAGHRVLSLPYAPYKRLAPSFRLSTEMTKL